MSDPNKDWLDEELENLRDLEAPTTLLPGVMRKVRERAGKSWRARLVGSPADLWRSAVVGLSLFLLGLLLVVNPIQLCAQTTGSSALLNLFPLLLEAGKAALSQVRIFNLPVLALVTPAIVLSYSVLVATASAIRHLANARR